MHKVNIDMIADQEITFKGIPINIHDIKSIIVGSNCEIKEIARLSDSEKKEERKQAFDDCIARAHKMNKELKWGIQSAMLGVCLYEANKRELFNPIKLKEFDNCDFIHDVIGLVQHWNHRGGGEFSDDFLPRSSGE